MTSNHATSSLAFSVIGLAILMAPTVAFARNGPTELRAHAESITIEYNNCVIEWVGLNLVASATPTEMAEGGHSKCLSKLQEFEEAQKTYLLSVTPPGQEFRAIEKAKSIASDIREMTKAHIIRLIIETRSGSHKR
jgi:hypothetical protein